MLTELLPLALLGFFGSFGHCVGMCGPLAAAFALSSQSERQGWGSLRFHLALNLGRLASYAAVGAAIGEVGEILVEGVGNDLRQAIAITTGLLLIWMALARLRPELLPQVPLLHPLASGLHERLGKALDRLAARQTWWTPAALGSIWGFIPCGFLFSAQGRTLAADGPWQGAALMLAFGLGTLPAMVGFGLGTAHLSRDRRSQLYRLGNWVTLAIGIQMLFRTGDATTSISGHGAIALLVLALLARPLAAWWPTFLQYRRAIGVGAYILAALHVTHTVAHTLGWNFSSIAFTPRLHQYAYGFGFAGLVLLTPVALTSFDRAQKVLGRNWRRLHLLGLPALLSIVVHSVLLGSHYLGSSELDRGDWFRAAFLIGIVGLTILLRWSRLWKFVHLENRYVPPAR